MSREIAGNTQGFFEIDLKHFLLGCKKIWWKVLLLCAGAALAGLLCARLTYVPSYSSYTTFVVSNKAGETPTAPDGLTIGDINASNALTNTFKYILLNDEAIQSIIDRYHLEMSIDRLRNRITITAVPNTNILEMKIASQNAVLSRDIADRIIERYPAALERTLKYASLEVLNPPRIAQAADSYSGNLTYPLLGTVIALLGSVIFVDIRQVFKDTIKTASDIKNRLSIPVLASIPEVKSPAKRGGKRASLYITDKSKRLRVYGILQSTSD